MCVISHCCCCLIHLPSPCSSCFRFEELGHVLNEAQAIQTLRQSGRNEGAAVEGEMQVELPAEAAPVTGEGTVAAPAVTAPEQAAEYGGGATQVAVFVCKEVSDKPMEPAGAQKTKLDA